MLEISGMMPRKSNETISQQAEFWFDAKMPQSLGGKREAQSLKNHKPQELDLTDR
jgi:hypothetical protein